MLRHLSSLSALRFCLILTLVWAGLEIFGTGLTNDTGVLMHYSIYLLREGDLYTHRFEVNPPLIMLLYTLPAWLVMHGVAPTIALHGFTFLGCAFSLWLLHRDLQIDSLETPRRYVWMGAACLLLVLFPPFPPVLADREHWLFIFIFPWLVLSLLGRPASLPAICFASIGFCIKPYNLIIALMMILFAGPSRSFQARIFSRASWVFGGVALAYLLLLFFCFRPYLTEILPIASLTYKTINMSLGYKLKKILVYGVPGLLLLAFSRGIRHRAYLALTCGCILVYMANGGWPYMDYVLCVPLGLIAAAILTDELQMRGLKGKETYVVGWGALGILFVCAAFGLYGEMESYRLYGHSRNYTILPKNEFTALQKAAGDRFVLLSGSLGGSILSKMDGTPHQMYKYEYLTSLPWLVQHADDEKASFVRDALTAPLIQALAAHPTLLIDESPYQRELPLHFALKDFFEKDATVKEAFAFYKRGDTLDFCETDSSMMCRFSVWHATTPDQPSSMP